MADTVADVLLARPLDRGARQVFDHPGDGGSMLPAADRPRLLKH